MVSNRIMSSFVSSGSPNTVDDLICSDDENPSELLELESPGNHTVAKVMTAEGVEDNISKSTGSFNGCCVYIFSVNYLI